MDSKQIGRLGEDIAAAHLERLGYRVLDRNWRDRAGEIDIVAMQGGVVVFVEVKTRRGVARGLPAEAVNADKLERMRRCALAWLSEHRIRNSGVRLDVIAILVEEDHHTVTHLQAVGQ